MLHFLSKKEILIGSLALMLIMFTIVMLLVNPSIDGGNGLGVIQLQLSFEKSIGLNIVNTWGDLGRTNFNRWIFTDYIYAFSYAMFFASLLSFLIIKKGMQHRKFYVFAVYVAFIAGFFDWLENTVELLLINSSTLVSNSLFFSHSIISVFKWAAIPIAVGYIILLLKKKNLETNQ